MMAPPPMYMLPAFSGVGYPMNSAIVDNGKGKGRADEAFEAAFREAEQATTGGASIVDLSELERTMDQLRVEQEAKASNGENLSDFQK
jgi:anti-sigma regulatory factor (Ser/Thr protein kinase)